MSPCLALLAACSLAAPAPLQVMPPHVALAGNFARCQLVVAAGPGKRAADLTHQARYASSNPKIVTVDTDGRLLAVANGSATVTVTAAGTTRIVPITVTGVVPAPHVSFLRQVLPVMSKAGCNAGACHASQFGKGGFKLSVFASEPAADREAIVRDREGRRANFFEPGHSLFLLKPTRTIPHEGGQRFRADSPDAALLRAWLADGAPPPNAKDPTVTALHVWPPHRIGQPGLKQQLRVVADYSNGSSRDVTAWAKYSSTDDGVLRVSPQGLVEATGRGQGGVLVRFETQATLALVVVPFAGTADLKGWVDQNFIDTLAAKKFRELGLTPAALCDDATFLRRAYFDATGSLPTVEEATAFLGSKDLAKRRKLVDHLLGPAHNEQYAAYWALKWADLLRCNSEELGEQGMWALHNWLIDSFRHNKPFDRFVRELVTARGTTHDYGPANFYVVFKNAEERTEATAQVFLGLRVQCARCHHHPFEKISRADFKGFASFFSQVGSKRAAEYGKLGGPQVIVVRPGGGKVPKRVLGFPLKAPAVRPMDRRELLAAWMTAPQNPYFARNVVNRYFGYLMGESLVEPIDDLRATNPPSNPELLDALAADFEKSGCDVKHLLRTIMTSRLYQLDAQRPAGAPVDTRFYSHYTVKRLPAEPLLDAVCSATGVPTKFDKVPLGTRAIELPDAKYKNPFLVVFGKPQRAGTCECERSADPNLAQALHTLNGAAILAKVSSPKGRVAKLVAVKKPLPAAVTELYLATLSRRPTAAELSACQQMRVEEPNDRTFYEDLLWSLVNSKQFLFVR